MAVQVATLSICTYLQGSPLMDYEYLLNIEVPQAYTTIKTEQQADKNMMGVVRALIRKVSVLPRMYRPLIWYNALLYLDGKPFRFLRQTENLRKIINASLRASSYSRPKYTFKFIQIPNRYWKEHVGYTRARPVARDKEHLDHQLQRLDFTRVLHWIEVTVEVRQRNRCRRMAPVQYEPAWKPQGKMTTTGDMLLVLHNIVISETPFWDPKYERCWRTNV